MKAHLKSIQTNPTTLKQTASVQLLRTFRPHLLSSSSGSASPPSSWMVIAGSLRFYFGVFFVQKQISVHEYEWMVCICLHDFPFFLDVSKKTYIFAYLMICITVVFWTIVIFWNHFWCFCWLKVIQMESCSVVERWRSIQTTRNQAPPIFFARSPYEDHQTKNPLDPQIAALVELLGSASRKVSHRLIQGHLDVKTCRGPRQLVAPKKSQASNETLLYVYSL